MSNFIDLYGQQIIFQSNLISKEVYKNHMLGCGDVKLPADYPQLVGYQIQQLVSEIGEVLSADKRWKSYRNEKYDLENKKEEIADCFIVLMNIAIFSGLSGDDLLDTIQDKINKNVKRGKSI